MTETHTHSSGLPVVGAAMRLHELPDYVEWLAANQRDLEIQDPFYQDYLDQDWMPLVTQGRSLLDASGHTGRVGIHAVFDGVYLATRDRKLREAMALRLRQSLEFAAELGATHAVIHSPFIYLGQHFTCYTPAASRRHMLDAVHTLLDTLLPFAEQIGCTLVLENIFDTNPHPLLDLVRSFASERVRLSLDTGHAFIMQQFGGPPPDQWIYEAGELLAHLHLQDNDGFDDRHWALGRGNINWYALFRALRTLEQQPRLILEMQETPDVLTSARWLEQNGLAR
jgi:sugar phosphate isomerase/epimerase